MKETHIFKVDIDTEERFIDFIHISKLHFLKWHQAIMTNTPKDISWTPLENIKNIDN